MSFSPVCELPPVVAFKLGEVRRRARRLEAAEGAVSAMSVLVLAMMAAMLIDDIVAPVDVRWRIALTGSALGLAALHLVRGLLRPLLLRRPLAAIAHRVEAAVPVLQERWSTLSELAYSRDSAAMLGSPALLDELSTEAVALSIQVEPRAVVPSNRLRGALVVLGVALAVLAAAFWLVPHQTAVLLQRFWSPRSAVTQTQLACPTGDQTVAIGEPLVLQATITGRERPMASLVMRPPAQSGFSDANSRQITIGAPVLVSEEASVRYELPTDGEPPEASALSGGPSAQVTGPRSLDHRLTAVRESFRYRWECGDARTPWFTIRAEARPTLARVECRIVPPPDSGVPEQELHALPRVIRAPRGSRLMLRFLPSKPLSHLALDLGGGRTEPVTDLEGPWYCHTMILDANAQLAPRLQDTHGLTNLQPPLCRLFADEGRPATRAAEPDDIAASASRPTPIELPVQQEEVGSSRTQPATGECRSHSGWSQRQQTEPPGTVGGNRPRAGPWEDGAAIDEREWNVFASSLRDELRQGAQISPPEEYRQAISQYFHDISERLAEINAQPAEK